ncbi:hypothetical protein TUA1478L_21270 [Lactiplantibacillus plantarum]
MANVLVVGGGGREHAIAKAMMASPQVSTVYCAPGNPGMIRDGIRTLAIDEMDFAGLVNFARANTVTLTFVGPEVPLAAALLITFKQPAWLSLAPTKLRHSWKVLRYSRRPS